METQTLITLEDLPSLKYAYVKAVKRDAKQFSYRGEILLTSYAKYLVEYLTYLNDLKNGKEEKRNNGGRTL